MSSSLILTNCLFCGLAILLLFPILRHPNILTFKKGLPVFVAILLLLGRLLMPYEFSFTYTLASKSVLPAIKTIENFYLFGNITIGIFILYIWISITILLLVWVISRDLKLIRTLSLVPATNNIQITEILSEICIQKQIKTKPKVIQLEINTGPFIVGFRNPIIVLPLGLSENEVKFVLLHELQHFKQHHILIKLSTEIVTAIYWWNPIIWFLRKEIIRALEIQADTRVMQGLSDKASLSYLETLINISKYMPQKQDTSLGLSFTLKSSMIKYRIHTALKFDCFQKHKRTPFFYVLPLVLSTGLFLFSFFYTFESYDIDQEMVVGTFVANTTTDYFVLREDKQYDWYVNGEFAITLPIIPDYLSNLPIHE